MNPADLSPTGLPPIPLLPTPLPTLQLIPAVPIPQTVDLIPMESTPELTPEEIEWLILSAQVRSGVVIGKDPRTQGG